SGNWGDHRGGADRSAGLSGRPNPSSMDRRTVVGRLTLVSVPVLRSSLDRSNQIGEALTSLRFHLSKFHSHVLSLYPANLRLSHVERPLITGYMNKESETFIGIDEEAHECSASNQGETNHEPRRPIRGS